MVDVLDPPEPPAPEPEPDPALLEALHDREDPVDETEDEGGD